MSAQLAVDPSQPWDRLIYAQFLRDIAENANTDGLSMRQCVRLDLCARLLERDAALASRVEALEDLLRVAVEGRVDDIGQWNRDVRAILTPKPSYGAIVEQADIDEGQP